MIFIYGEEEFLINKELKTLVNSKDSSISFYSDKDSIDDIIMDATTVSIFDANKTIVIKNHEVFEDDKLGKKLFDSIRDDVDHINLICVYEEGKLKKTNAFINFLLDKAEVRKMDKITSKEVVSTIKTLVLEQGGDISNAAAVKLASKLPENLRLIVSEVEKLLFESKIITEEMVDNSIGEYLTDDYFALANALVSSDRRELVIAYRDRLHAGESIQLIIGQIASTLNLSMLVASYRKQGMSSQDISDTLNVHIFRIKKANELINSTSAEHIESLLIQLAKLDKDIKTGLVDEEKGMDHLILQLIK